MITAAQHDSNDGWSSVLTPGAAWRFSPALSVNASLPIFTSVNVVTNTGTMARPNLVSETKHGVMGDAALGATLEFHPEVFSYTTSLVLGLPSGNTSYGLGAGRASYSFNNRFEKDLGMVTANVEAGIANSSSLISGRAHRSYVAAGRLAHFQLGASLDMPHDISFEADAYEDMPVASSTIYSSTNKGKKVTTTQATSAAEDNGLNLALDVPLNGHVTVSGFFTHSIRGQYDVGGFSLTFLLNAPPHHKDGG
jgi:hypothetical protein